MNLVLKLCRIANQIPVFFAANCIDSTSELIHGSRGKKRFIIVG